MSATLTRLQPHQIVLFQRPFRVARVNDCRAYIIPVAKKRRELAPETGRNAGKKIAFEESADGVGISPNSELEIIGQWDPATETARYFPGYEHFAQAGAEVTRRQPDTESIESQTPELL